MLNPISSPLAGRVRSLEEGPLFITGNPLDVSIEGPGFLAVHRGDGSRALTRAGDLQIAGSGSVVTASGHRLDPPLVLPLGTNAEELRIAPDGTVTAGDLTIGCIEVVDVPAPEGLLELGGGLYAPTVASGPPVPIGSPLRQGTLEGSNVSLAGETAEALTQHESAASVAVLRTADEQLEALLGIRK